MIAARKLGITGEASKHVQTLMQNDWDNRLLYHNLGHTMQVLEAAQEISRALRLIPSEIEVLELGAWFHDTGYKSGSEGHEEAGALHAEEFLARMHYPDRIIRKVCGCIRATKCPQKPTNLLEEILCDADLYHLSTSNFSKTSEALRQEQARFGIVYTNAEWLQLNLDFFEKHHYWTTYGRDVLARRKRRNLEELLKTAGTQA